MDFANRDSAVRYVFAEVPPRPTSLSLLQDFARRVRALFRTPAILLVPLAIGIASGWHLSLKVPRSLAERLGDVRLIPGHFVDSTTEAERDDLIRSLRRRLEAELEMAKNELESQPSPEASHAAGVFRLALGQYDKAIVDLQQAVEERPNEALWRNDLASAFLTRARVQNDRNPLDRAKALNEAESAWQAQGNPDSCAWRVVALEANTLVLEAAKVWRECLKEHPALMARGVPISPPASVLDHWTPIATILLSCPADLNAEEANRWVRRFPQETRQLLQDRLLPLWAESELAGRYKVAEACLQTAELLGHQLARWRGEHSAADSLLTVRSALPGPARAKLARGYVAYGMARMLYENGHPEEARPLFEAASAFFGLRDPAARAWTGLWLGGIEFFANRYTEAACRFDLLLAQPRIDRYPALRGRLLWAAGLQKVMLGELSPALKSYRVAEEIFHKLGEAENAGGIAYLLAEGHQLAGDSETAARFRKASLDLLKAYPIGVRRVNALLQASIVEMDADLPLAASWFALEALDASVASGQADQLSEALIQLARASDKGPSWINPTIEWSRIKKAVAATESQSLRHRNETELLMTRARIAASGRAPCNTLELAELVRRGESTSSPLLLAMGISQQARCFIRSGNITQAHKLLQRAVTIADSVGSAIAEPSLATLFHETYQSVFDDLIQIELDTDHVLPALLAYDHAQAFDGRKLHRKRLLPRMFARLQSQLPQDEIVLVYCVLPHKIAAWKIDSRGLSVTSILIERMLLAKIITHLEDSLKRARRIEDIHLECSNLFRIFLEPLLPERMPTAITILPDRELDFLPFSVLLHRDQFLFQTTTVAYGSHLSAALIAWRKFSLLEVKTTDSMISIASSDPGVIYGRQLATLPSAKIEALTIATLYNYHQILTGQVTIASAVRALKNAQVFHFAGHALRNTGVELAGLVFSSGVQAVVWHPDEIAIINLSHLKLVVLAACRSGRRDSEKRITPDDTMYAFLSAGAQSVIASLWNLPDNETYKPLVTLHYALIHRANVREALRKMQEQMFLGNAEPFQWAGFRILI